MRNEEFRPERCCFLFGAGRADRAPETSLPEVAVAGRSNVGKSSLINFLLGRRGLARTSGMPGRTQELNFFSVDERLVLVDLPGYGYARAPWEEVRRWLEAIARFVRGREALRGVVLLLDIRRDPSPEDQAFARMVRDAERLLLPVVTKADKVARGQRPGRLAAIAAAIGVAPTELRVTSTKDRLGRGETWKGILAMVEGAAGPAPVGSAPPRALVVAVDGPSGAGKSTVARSLAGRLGWNHVDTGAMYRSIGLKADRLGVALDDDAALEAVCRETRLELGRRPDGTLAVLLDGEDVSEAIREHRVSELASRVSARAPVRAAMTGYQRELGLASPSVLEGRDIGTVVFPDAVLKVYLTASDLERAERRARELELRGEPVDREQLLGDLRERDRADSVRAHAPLRQAPDAVVVDTTGRGVDEVVELLVQLVHEAVGGGAPTTAGDPAAVRELSPVRK
ncbi:MAG: (d)CMP kinase [Deltaproteobacteria bacterium]|nr:(d)CMP kinase [Deltaproteobacteria bacterium]